MTDLNQEVNVVNIGLEGFSNELRSLDVPVVQVQWHPPAGGDKKLISTLARLRGKKYDRANEVTVARMLRSRPIWVDVDSAGKVIPGMQPNHILHSGPPIPFEEMCDPQQRAVEGAAIFEGWIKNEAQLRKKLRSGELVLAPNYTLNSVGPMCGVITPSMAVIVTRNAAFRNRSWSTFNEGKGNVLWMGTYDDGTIERLKWIANVLGPGLKEALKHSEGGIDLFGILAEGTQMGDEAHARSAACSSLLLQRLYPLLLKTGLDKRTILEVVEFIISNNHFFLNLTLTACKVTADAAHGVKNSTIVTGMSRNGVDFALRVGGVADRWFISETAPMDEAIYYSGYSPEDAAGDIGDSAIIETVGLGGMVIGAAPTISSFVGGTMQDSLQAMKSMKSICQGVNPKFAPAAVDFMSAPVGIDIRKVIKTGVAPIIDTGVIHKSSGVGQIGAGIARAPMDVFVKALNYMEKNSE